MSELFCRAAVLSAIPMHSVSSENSFDRIQAGEWVVASMYWESKLVSTGKASARRMACSTQDMPIDIDPRIQPEESSFD